MLTANEIKNNIDLALEKDGGDLFRRYLKQYVFELKDAFNNDSVNHPRLYLGASGLGSECAARIWLDFRHVLDKPLSAKSIRLLNRGHLEEARFLAMLSAAGYNIKQNIENGQQIQYKFEYGYIKGHIDGILEHNGDFYLLEFKTANDKNFNNFTKKGLLEANKQYFVQVQLYMYAMNLEQCIFMVINKNTDDLYIEIIVKDSAIGQAYLDYGQKIIYNRTCPPANESYICNFCDYKELCFNTDSEKNINKNCRTCGYFKILGDELNPTNKSFCLYHNLEIEGNEVFQGAECYEYKRRIYDNT